MEASGSAFDFGAFYFAERPPSHEAEPDSLNLHPLLLSNQQEDPSHMLEVGVI